MTDHWDVIVIGAGPAGLLAAGTARAAGLKTLLIERFTEIGRPVNCAEGVTAATFDSLIDARPQWIRSHPRRGRIVSPSGSIFELRHKHGGYVLDRYRIENDLADQFTAAGGELHLGCTALQLQRDRDRFATVVCETGQGTSVALAADLFIAADGVESTIARRAGIDNHLDLTAMESFLQYRLGRISVDSDVIEVWLGESVAPRSYAWIFPLSGTEANVGLGVPAHFDNHRSVRSYLDRFVDRLFPGAERLAVACGTSPRYQGRDRLSRDNLIVVGDAARLQDSVTGEGIAYAISSGQLAGQAAAAYLNEWAGSPDLLHELYSNKIATEYHTKLDWLRRLKLLLDKMTDRDFDDIVGGLSDYFGDEPAENINIVKTFAGVIRKKPRLLRLARHLL